MGEDARLDDAVAALNAQLGDITPYKLAVVDPAALVPVEKNAHYLPKATFDRLADNIARDGNLSTLPFCWRTPAGDYIVLSGNHRVLAAKTAKITRILILFTDQALTRAEQVAIQLSHNALVGQDNPTQLLELWHEIDDLGMKVYSGLDDALLATLKPVEMVRVAEGTLHFEELRVLFLSSEIATMADVLKRLGDAKRPRFAARFEEWERFWDVLLTFKEAEGIKNTATALLAMIEIVERHLTDKGTDHAGNEPQAPGD
jgi:hypothetical protein